MTKDNIRDQLRNAGVPYKVVLDTDTKLPSPTDLNIIQDPEDDELRYCNYQALSFENQTLNGKTRTHGPQLTKINGAITYWFTANFLQSSKSVERGQLNRFIYCFPYSFKELFGSLQQPAEFISKVIRMHSP